MEGVRNEIEIPERRFLNFYVPLYFHYHYVFPPLPLVHLPPSILKRVDLKPVVSDDENEMTFF